jgi:hypothetical protein
MKHHATNYSVHAVCIKLAIHVLLISNGTGLLSNDVLYSGRMTCLCWRGYLRGRTGMHMFSGHCGCGSLQAVMTIPAPGSCHRTD